MDIIGKKRRRQQTVYYNHIVLEDGVLSGEGSTTTSRATAMSRHDSYVRRAQASFAGERKDIPGIWDSRVLEGQRMIVRRTGFIYSSTRYSIRVVGSGFLGTSTTLSERLLPSGLQNARSSYLTMTSYPDRFSLPRSGWNQSVVAKLVRQDPRSGESVVDSRVL